MKASFLQSAVVCCCMREREKEAQATSAAREWQLRGIEKENSSRLVRHSFALIPGTQHCSTLSSANRSPHGDCPTFILQKKCQCTSWKTFTWKQQQHSTRTSRRRQKNKEKTIYMYICCSWLSFSQNLVMLTHSFLQQTSIFLLAPWDQLTVSPYLAEKAQQSSQSKRSTT